MNRKRWSAKKCYVYHPGAERCSVKRLMVVHLDLRSRDSLHSSGLLLKWLMFATMDVASKDLWMALLGRPGNTGKEPANR